jgi:hypothetical protein
MGLKIPEIPTAKPRLAVALDFADTVGGKVNDKKIQGVIESAVYDGNTNELKIKITKDLNIGKSKLFESVSIYVYPFRDQEISTPVQQISDTEYSAHLSATAYKTLTKALENISKKTIFINFKLSNAILQTLKNYDISKDWTYQIELLDMPQYKLDTEWPKEAHFNRGKHHLERRARFLQQFNNQILIRRHSRWGEVPDHKWYSSNIKDEYDFPWRKYEKAQDDNNLN